MDVAVVHPLAPTTPVCGVKDGSEAIAGMERVKIAKYPDACRESNIRFIPFVLSTFGKLGGEGDRFFQHLAGTWATFTCNNCRWCCAARPRVCCCMDRQAIHLPPQSGR